MSVTYGATGGTSDYTVELASEVEKHQIPALAHLTCASSTKEKVASVIEELKEKQDVYKRQGFFPTSFARSIEMRR